MSYLLGAERVLYECSCSHLKPITALYFCRHCLKLRCSYCVSHEVDSHYCSNCMEHLPSAEAKLKKNRCSSCSDCPNCFHTLSVRATSRGGGTEDSSATNKTPTKHYYLACFFCRWTSRDVGIPDQSIATGSWPVKENPCAEKLHSLIEHYKIVALRERAAKEKKNYTPRRPYSTYTEKYGLSAMIARKRAGLPPLSLPVVGHTKEISLINLPPIAPSQPVDTPQPLPDHYLTQPPDLTKVTTLEQRHANPGVQGELVSELYPQHRHFYIKRSLRCRECEHNLSKPEYNPASIKFKIQLSAYYHMPEVKIVTCGLLEEGGSTELILKLTNPTQHMTSIHFSQVDKSEARKRRGREVTTHVEVSESPVVLPPRDDAAEYDDTADTHTFNDDPKLVVWRKGNKCGVRVLVRGKPGLKAGSLLTAALAVDYNYVNTMPSLEQKQPSRSEIEAYVFLTLGTLLPSPIQ